MAYIDEEYYSGQFKGKAIPQEEFEVLAQRASEIIDALLPYPLQDAANPAEAVKKATAYQLEHLYAQGGIDALTGFAAGLASSESLGSYSVSGANGSAGRFLEGVPISAIAHTTLSAAGLLCRWT